MTKIIKKTGYNKGSDNPMYGRFGEKHPMFGKTGNKSPNYKGGTRIQNKVYTQILKPEHPYCNSIGYIQKHRLIYENYLSIILDEEIFIPKNYEIHHIIPVKEGGTNALINLELLPKAEHSRMHMIGNKRGKKKN